MTFLLYIGSIITSVIGFAMIITLTFAEEDSGINRFFGEKETIIVVVMAFVLMVIGFLSDRR